VLVADIPGGVRVALEFPARSPLHARQPLDGLTLGWLQELAVRGRKPATIEAYRGDVLAFQNWARGRGIDDWRQVDDDSVAAFLAAEAAREIGLRLMARRVGTLRALFEHALDLGHTLAQITLRTRQPSKAPTFPEQAELERAMRVCSGADFFAIRDRALLELLCATGLTLREIRALDLDDLDMARGFVAVNCRRFRSRRIPIAPRVVEALRPWLRVRRTASLGKDALAVFTSAHGFRLKLGSITELVARRSIAAGVVPVLTPRAIRMSVAVHLFESGADRDQIGRLLGLSRARIEDLRRLSDPARRRNLQAFRTILKRVYEP